MAFYTVVASMKIICLLIVIFMSAVGLGAKRFYFDAGVGYGFVKDISLSEIPYPKPFSELGLDFGFRLGYLLGERFIIVADRQYNFSGEVELHFEVDVDEESWLNPDRGSFREIVHSSYYWRWFNLLPNSTHSNRSNIWIF